MSIIYVDFKKRSIMSESDVVLESKMIGLKNHHEKPDSIPVTEREKQIDVALDSVLDSHMSEVKITTYQPTKKTRSVNKVGDFKYQPKNNKYIKSNCFFDATTIQAYSYDWYCFVKSIEGKVVFNDAKYSRTTQRHQRQVESLLRHLNIEIDLRVNIEDGLQVIESIKELKKLNKKSA